MLRFIGFLTLVLVAICLAIGASIALASDGVVPAAGVYEFDFAVGPSGELHPEFDEPSDFLDI